MRASFWRVQEFPAERSARSICGALRPPWPGCSAYKSRRPRAAISSPLTKLVRASGAGSSAAAEFARKLLAELADFWAHHKGAVRLGWIVPEIVLVVVLGAIQGRGRLDFCDNRIRPDPLRIQFANDLLGSRTLLVRVIKND